jgi:hypothetical protein
MLRLELLASFAGGGLLGVVVAAGVFLYIPSSLNSDPAQNIMVLETALGFDVSETMS